MDENERLNLSVNIGKVDFMLNILSDVPLMHKQDFSDLISAVIRRQDALKQLLETHTMICHIFKKYCIAREE